MRKPASATDAGSRKSNRFLISAGFSAFVGLIGVLPPETTLTKAQEQRQAIEMLCTDMLVPQDHLLRKTDAAVDFKHIYGIVENLYCEDNGRPSIDPVVLFKLVMIQHLFGIRSLRQTMKDGKSTWRIVGFWDTACRSLCRILQR